MNKKRPTHKFNLRALEDNALNAYAEWKQEDSEKTRTEFYLKIRELSFAVLSVGNYHKNGINIDEVTYEYSLYFFERVIIGRPERKGDKKKLVRFELKAHGDRFPLQHYIRNNIKHVIFTLKESSSWKEVISDLEFLLEEHKEGSQMEDPIPPPFYFIDKENYARRLFKVLQIFYPVADIQRLLGLSLEMIYENKHQLIQESYPKELQDFAVILISSAKRIVRDENVPFLTDVSKKELQKAISAATRSSLFLSTVVNSKFIPREFLLALDIGSLYRLVDLLGGRRIRVPTARQLNTLIGAVVTASKLVLEDKEIGQEVKDTKRDFDLVFSNRVNIQYFISKLIETYRSLPVESSSEPMIQSLLKSIESLEKFSQELTRRSKKTDSESLLVQEYLKLIPIFSHLSSAMKNVDASFLKTKDVTYV